MAYESLTVGVFIDSNHTVAIQNCVSLVTAGTISHIVALLANRVDWHTLSVGGHIESVGALNTS